MGMDSGPGLTAHIEVAPAADQPSELVPNSGSMVRCACADLHRHIHHVLERCPFGAAQSLHERIDDHASVLDMLLDLPESCRPFSHCAGAVLCGVSLLFQALMKRQLHS